MKKRKNNINPSRRKFLTGSATVAGVAAASALVPISFLRKSYCQRC